MTEEFKEIQTKVREWVETAMAHKQALVEMNNNDLGLDLCGERNDVYTYIGIEKIAFYLGLTLTYNPNWDPEGNRGYISTMYKGIEIYELWGKGACTK